MPIKQIDYGTGEYDQMVNLRKEILRKPLHLTFEAEELYSERNDMAVQNNLQGKGIGASMMNFAENLARDSGYKKLIMHARKSAIGFYEKLGYKVSGDEFMEVSIPHFIMLKKLTY